MSLLYCTVCLKDFVSASARTKHEATCKDPPLDHAELTKLVYKLNRETKRDLEAVRKELKDMTKKYNDLKRSRVDAPAKGKPGPFPEITGTDLWDFLDKGLLHLVCSKDWPVFVDGDCIMVYKHCEESNKEAWQEALDEDLLSLTTKIKQTLNDCFKKNVSKIMNSKEGKGPEHEWQKISDIDSKAVKKAFLEAKEMYSD